MPQYHYCFQNIYLHITCLDNLDVAHIQLSKTPSSSGNQSLPIALKTPLDDFFYQREERVLLPYQLTVTSFQKKVLELLTEIKRGQTKSYQALANSLKSHPRAIGQALKRNPLPLIFPCHRIIAKNGLGGFMGSTEGVHLSIKKTLLDIESL